METRKVGEQSGAELKNIGNISTSAADPLMGHRCAAGGREGREATPQNIPNQTKWIPYVFLSMVRAACHSTLSLMNQPSVIFDFPKEGRRRKR